MTALFARLFGSAIVSAGLLTVAVGVSQASPAMEWAWIGPYSSTWTCEQARDLWPSSSKPCQQRADGAYFYGLRQAG